MSRRTQNINVETLVNRLGEIKSCIDELKEKEDELREELMRRRVRRVSTSEYQCIVSRFYVNRVDYNSLLESLEPALIEKFTSKEKQTRVIIRPHH